MSRLAGGGLIDRTRPMSFRFDGRDYRGFAGDTLASALIANDVRLIGRSFKYHRPRGILTAGPEEPNALVTLRTGARAEPNTRATTAELYDGLEAVSQNRWPNLTLDLMAVNGLLSPLFVAGFYYKTFMWPGKFWEKLYEPLIRRAAGLGALSGLPDPDSYDRDHHFCDMLVVGAGAAGLTAALAAGRAGARVLLVEEDAVLGGRLLAERHVIDGASAHGWLRRTELELRALPNVTILIRTGVFGRYDGNTFGAIERVADHLAEPIPGQPRQRLWKIVARHAILATGAIERPIGFAGNDRPGVMMASAVQAYVHRYAAVPGRRIAVFTTGDSGLKVARDLEAAGVPPVAIVDARRGETVIAARGKTLKAIDIRAADGRVRRVRTDVLAMAGGWNPAIGIGSHLGARPTWSNAISAFRFGTPPPGISFAGAADGHFALADALASGHGEASTALAALGLTAPPADVLNVGEEGAGVSDPLLVEGARGKSFVDFQHDVTESDVALAVREGYRSVEHLKRYTTLGMATDQGKSGQVNGHALLARLGNRAIEDVGTVMSRPPWQPVAIGAFAGSHREADFRPVRRTAGHGWAADQGASFVDVGMWKRPEWFTRNGETDWLQSVSREAAAVRAAVGLCDVSTLGKIEIAGPDAGRLLDLLYANMMSTLPVGKARYGLMLREDGFVLDDGTAARLAENRFVISTTTANAGRVMQHVDYARHVLAPGLDVQAVSVTEQWAQYAVAGPNARWTVQALLPDLDLSNDAFGFMAATACRWRNGPARLFRLSFSGELAYEIAVPANRGAALARALMAVGQPYGITPYGTEALGVLRIEKGHPAGNELNGQTTAHDLGMGRMLSGKKDFIGRALAGRAALTDPARPRLVGLRPIDRAQRVYGGAHLLPLGAPADAANDQGYVTSVCFSPALGQWIALGLLSHGPDRVGERVRAVSPVRGTDFEMDVCSPVFVDPEGVLVRG